MKLVFFSSDRIEVESLHKELAAAGIPCEIHDGVTLAEALALQPEAELWIQNNTDSHRAFMVCAEHAVGFSKRAGNPVAWDEPWSEALAA